MVHFFHRLRAFSSLIDASALAFKFNYCPICDGIRPMIRMGYSGMATRCLSCQSGTVTMSMASILAEKIPDLHEKHAYELSSRGSLFDFLKKKAGKLTSSEYADSVPPGHLIRDQIYCQDVQSLTFPDCQFDVCTSTEVFEHVPDDLRGFAEIYRVLKPGGYHIFSVPIHLDAVTRERATLKNGELVHLVTPPEYHKDPFHGENILAYRNYGFDIIERLRECGFVECEIATPSRRMPWGYAQPIIVARKPAR